MRKLRLIFSGLLFIFVNQAFANNPFNIEWPGINIPQYFGGLYFSLTAFSLRPATEEVYYALIYPLNTDSSISTVVFQNGVYSNARPGYEWGLRGKVGYKFPCTGYDVAAVYSYLDQNESHHSESVPFNLFSSFILERGNNFGVSNLSISYPSGLTINVTLPIGMTLASARSIFSYRSWDFEFAQNVSVGCNLSFRAFGGLRYVDMSHVLKARYFGQNNTLTHNNVTENRITAEAIFSAHEDSSVQAIGPRFGINGIYFLPHALGVGVTGEVSSSLLAGDIRSKYKDLLTQTVLTRRVVPGSGAIVESAVKTINTPISYEFPDEPRIIPNIDGRLGLRWQYIFCNPSHSLISIEAGWMVTKYFGTVDSLSGEGAALPEARTRHVTNTSFDGPYIEAKWDL